MPLRVTKRELEHTVKVLATRGHNIAIAWAYGQPRVTTQDESKELSPRLPAQEMRQWLDGFEAGAKSEYYAGIKYASPAYNFLKELYDADLINEEWTEHYERLQAILKDYEDDYYSRY